MSCCQSLWVEYLDGLSLCENFTGCRKCHNDFSPFACPFSDRKLRLYICSLFRSMESDHHFIKENQEAIAAAEESPQRIPSTGTDADPDWNGCLFDPLSGLNDILAIPSLSGQGVKQNIPRKHQANLLRQLVGNPFRSPRFEPAWRSPDVLAVAQLAYQERNKSHCLMTDNLAVLADALLDAGCNDHLLLSELRSPGPHYRGFHVLDTILELE